ncbi:MAG: tRNA (adenosine(37)-N6)-threonylcarbamoyltransferase complex dimerization subunit type 1 TsaB [Bacteroidales bacterium]|nr:tRNA (adenosine(37)-N6)-threonylcarbamoyltransferase complex dimerization subunit type 1 TsaB [Bacteroidales bacterium]
MIKILQIETATDVCSVSVAINGRVETIIETGETRTHSASLVPFIEKIYSCGKHNDIDAVAVSMGPGSYTGLRIGVSVAKGICYGGGIPLIAISTLESMVNGYIQQLENNPPENSLFLPMIDARRMEVYTAIYNKEKVSIEETRALIVEPDTFNSYLMKYKLYLFGPGAAKIKSVIQHRNLYISDDFKMSSEYMSELVYKKYKMKNFEDTAYFEPFYLKDFITTISKKKVI